MDKPLIDVVYADGVVSTVHNDLLDILIATRKIIGFKRAEGWVNITQAANRLRDYSRAPVYSGPERRAPWPLKK